MGVGGWQGEWRLHMCHTLSFLDNNNQDGQEQGASQKRCIGAKKKETTRSNNGTEVGKYGECWGEYAS